VYWAVKKEKKSFHLTRPLYRIFMPFLSAKRIDILQRIGTTCLQLAWTFIPIISTRNRFCIFVFFETRTYGKSVCHAKYALNLKVYFGELFNQCFQFFTFCLFCMIQRWLKCIHLGRNNSNHFLFIELLSCSFAFVSSLKLIIVAYKLVYVFSLCVWFKCGHHNAF